MINLMIVFFVILAGCGYTTRGFLSTEKTITVAPVVNDISITSENRRYATYTVYPILLEKKLTNAIINKFNIEGHLKVVAESSQALHLTCNIKEYKREVVRYTNSEDIKEQRLRLVTHIRLTDRNGVVLKEKDIIGEMESYFLSGPNSISESAAQDKLVDDAARRIMEAVVEEW